LIQGASYPLLSEINIGLPLIFSDIHFAKAFDEAVNISFSHAFPKHQPALLVGFSAKSSCSVQRPPS
jgi:hypothetical protein